MFTPARLDQLHEEIFQLMLKAGWLLNFSFTVGKGWHLGWTEEGSPRAAALKSIATTFGLQNDDRAPLIFDKRARGETLPKLARPFDLDDRLATFWRESIDALKLPRDEDHLIVLVGIVTSWAPDLDTPVKFYAP